MIRRLLCGVACAAVLSTSLAGCATSEVAIQTELARAKAEQMNEVATRPMAPANVSPVKVHDAVYMGASVTHADHGQPMPPSLERKVMSLHKGQTMGFQEVANLIAREAKVPVVVALTTPSKGSLPQASGGGYPSSASPASQYQQAAPRGANAQGVTAARPPNMTPPAVGGLASGPLPPNFDVNAAAAAILSSQQSSSGMVPMPASMQQSVPMQQITGVDDNVGDLGIPGRMRVDFDGPLPGLLDLVATNYNVGWEYVDGSIVFERALMRNFEIPALPILAKEEFKMSSESNNGSGGGSQGTGATATGEAKQSASTETTYDIQNDIKAALDTVVTDGAYKYNSHTGQVTVMASPMTIRRVGQYVKDLNSQLAKQIAINVKVYSVVLQDGDDYQNQIQLAIGGKRGQVAGYGTNGTAASSVSSSISGATSAAGNFGWAILSPSSRFAGTNGLVTALSTKGDVSVVTSASVVAMNGVPVPLQVANTRGYAAQVSVTQGTSGLTSAGPTSSITPGSVTTGFNLHLLPKVMKDGSLLLQYGMNISELVGATNGFDTFSTPDGTASIQLPNVNQRNFIQEAMLPNGGTLVLTGFEQVRASAQVAGPISPALFPLGGSDQSNLRREILVIAITPTLLDASASANPPSLN